ncbi:hypothetical protein PINS_up008468 [Pythium insidiosum]|nr:hypothetical protein PINS_up008468 [Pythium insidiosum]
MIPPGFTIDDAQSTHLNDNQEEHGPQETGRPVYVDEASLKQLAATKLRDDKRHVAFLGVFVVQSPTEERHVRYAMEVAAPELGLQLRVTQRFRNYHRLRRRLLRVLTKCQDLAYRPNTDECSGELRLTWPHGGCRDCGAVRKQLKRAAFPSRAVFTTANVVESRPLALEAFLESCVTALVEWQGCERGKKLFSVVLGRFLGVNLLFHMFQQLRLTMEVSESEMEAHEASRHVSNDDVAVA